MQPQQQTTSPKTRSHFAVQATSDSSEIKGHHYRTSGRSLAGDDVGQFEYASQALEQMACEGGDESAKA